MNPLSCVDNDVVVCRSVQFCLKLPNCDTGLTDSAVTNALPTAVRTDSAVTNALPTAVCTESLVTHALPTAVCTHSAVTNAIPTAV
jgi:hypothetical protein